MAGDVGLDLVKEQGQDDRHGEAEAQAIEAEDKGVAHGAPELGGQIVAADKQALEVGEAGEQLFGYRKDLIGNLEAAKQLIHGEVAPEQKYQEHGDQHEVQPPILQDRTPDVKPIVFFHVVADGLLRAFTV